MKSQRKFKPGWDDASYLMRTDVEREKKPRLESGKLPEQEFSFDFAAIRKKRRGLAGPIGIRG